MLTTKHRNATLSIFSSIMSTPNIVFSPCRYYLQEPLINQITTDPNDTLATEISVPAFTSDIVPVTGTIASSAHLPHNTSNPPALPDNIMQPTETIPVRAPLPPFFTNMPTLPAFLMPPSDTLHFRAPLPLNDIFPTEIIRNESSATTFIVAPKMVTDQRLPKRNTNRKSSPGENTSRKKTVGLH